MIRTALLCAVLALSGCGMLGQRDDCKPEMLPPGVAADSVAWGAAAGRAADLASLGSPAAYGVGAGALYLYSAWRKAPCSKPPE